MPALLLWFLGPIGRYVGIALLAAAVVGGVRAKWYFDDQATFTAKLEAKKQHDITKADAARRSAVRRYDAGKLRNDGYRRD